MEDDSGAVEGFTVREQSSAATAPVYTESYSTNLFHSG